MRDNRPFSAKAKARAGFLPADAAREAEAAQVPGLQARIAAANVIADVAQGGHRLDERFSPQAVPYRLAGMEPRDIGLARSIAYVGVRRLGAIRHALALLLEKGLPKQAARLEWPLVAAAAQILFLDVPDHAAVDLAVRAVRLEPKTTPFAGLVNGVLRNLIRRREEFLGADPLDLDTPAWLAQRWIKSYGEAQARAIAAIHMQEPPIDLTVKSDAEGWAQRLDGIVLPTGSVRLRARTPIVELDAYAEGEWWVQDAAAALPARLLAVEPDERVLDMCAAPGGKTAQLALARAQVQDGARSIRRAAEAARRQSAARPPARRHSGGRRRLLFRRASLRRHSARCALLGDGDDPPSSRRALDQEARRSRFPRRAAIAHIGAHRLPAAARRAPRLLHLLAGAGGGRGANRELPAPSSRDAPRADRRRRRSRSGGIRDAGRRFAHAAILLAE
jgi:hypothetical protein